MVGGELYRILQWTRDQGEVKAFERLRLRLLKHTVRERLMLDRVTAETQCSDAYLAEARAAAGEIVGTKCPF